MKKVYTEKVSRYMAKNPGHKVEEIDSKLINCDLLKRIKNIKDDTEYVILDNFPNELFPILKKEDRDLIINKGIYLRLSKEKEYSIAFILQEKGYNAQNLKLENFFDPGKIKFIYGITKNELEIINKCEKVVCFSDNYDGNIHKLLCSFTGNIDFYGEVPIEYLNAISHLKNITIKSATKQSLRSTFNVIKKEYEENKNIEIVKYKEEISVLRFKDIYCDMIRDCKINSPIIIYRKDNCSSETEYLLEQEIKRIFSSNSFIDKMDVIKSLSKFKLFPHLLTKFKDNKSISERILLFCYLLIFARLDKNISLSNILDDQSIDRILKSYNHNSNIEVITDNFNQLIHGEKDTTKDIRFLNSKFLRYFFPNYFDYNSLELLFFLQFQSLNFKGIDVLELYHTKYGSLLSNFLQHISNNFKTPIVHELFFILFSYDKKFFSSNISNLMCTRFGLDICMLLSIEDSKTDIINHIIDSFNSFSDSLSENHLCLFTIYKFYLEKYLKLEITWRKDISKIKISNFISRIHSHDFSFKRILSSPFQLALILFYLKSNMMLDDYELLENHLKYKNYNFIYLDQYMTKLNNA